jgi:hypothetical protein
MVEQLMVRRPPGHGFWFSDGEGSGRAAGAFVGDQYRPGPGAMLVVLTHHLNMFVNRDGSTRLWRAAGDEFLGSTMAHWKNVTSNMGFEWAPANADGSFPQCYFMNVVVAEEHSVVHCFRAKRKGTAGVPDPAALMVKLSWAHNIVITRLLATFNHLLHSSPLSLHYCTRCTHRTRCTLAASTELTAPTACRCETSTTATISGSRAASGTRWTIRAPRTTRARWRTSWCSGRRRRWRCCTCWRTTLPRARPRPVAAAAAAVGPAAAGAKAKAGVGAQG